MAYPTGPGPFVSRKLAELASENERLREALERLASSEALGAPGYIGGNSMPEKELRLRLDFARAALKGE